MTIDWSKPLKSDNKYTLLLPPDGTGDARRRVCIANKIDHDGKPTFYTVYLYDEDGNFSGATPESRLRLSNAQ